MRARIIGLLVASALVAGCTSKSGTSLVVVSVDADASLTDVATLHARVAVGDQTREFDVHPTAGASTAIPPAQTFGINLPRTLVGNIELSVDARDSGGATIASGGGSGTIRVGARSDVALTLSAVVVAAPDLGQPSTSSPPDMAQPQPDMFVAPAMLAIDHAAAPFGDITVHNTSTNAKFKISNVGETTSGVPMLQTSGAQLSEFTITTDCSAALPPRGICYVTASVTPTSTGMKSAAFAVTASPGGQVNASLSANALPVGTLTMDTTTGDCGSALLGNQSTTTATFSVKNVGSSASGVPTVKTGDAQFTASGCTSAVAPGASCTVTVAFRPATRGTQNTSLSVSASPGGTATASLSGVGLKPATVNVSPASFTFAGSTPRQSSGGPTSSFTVTNDGDVPSPTLAVATLTGSGASSFAIATDGCQGSALGPAPSQCTVAVQFTPQVTGTTTATLNVNGPAGALTTAKVSGNGAPIWLQEAVDLTLKTLNAVWTADSAHVYAVGYAGTIVYRGPTGTWSTRTLAKSPPPDLFSVSGSSATDVYVAGGGIFQSSDSATWSPWQTGSYSSVVVFPGADLWATLNDSTATPPTAVYHMIAGTGWTQVTGAIPLGFLWGTSGADLYSFGGDSQCGLGACTFYSGIAHPDSSGKWVRQFIEGSPGPNSISSLWGFGVPANNLYAVADTKRLPLHSAGDGKWTEMTSGAPSGCSAVWGADGGHVWFGCAGLYAYDGNGGWSAPVVTTLHVHGIYGTDGNNVYAVGDDGHGNGAIYHYY